MKLWLKVVLPAIIAFSLTGCFDTTEEIEIDKKGNGSLVVNMDMGKIFEMMKGFMSQEDLTKDSLDRAIDTTIFMKSYLDTATNVSPEQKAIFKDGVVHMNMDVKNSVFKLNMRYPFTSYDNLNKLYGYLQQGEGGIMDVLKAMPGKEGVVPKPSGDEKMAQMNAVYDMQVKDGLYTKTLNRQRYEELKSNPKVEEMKGMIGMMGDMNYTLVVKLPRAVKKVSNATATLSADKKTVTMKSNLVDVLDKPELLEIKIDY
jgi:hypothetical protein